MSKELETLSRDELIARLNEQDASSKTAHPTTGSIVKSAFVLWLTGFLFVIFIAIIILVIAVSVA